LKVKQKRYVIQVFDVIVRKVDPAQVSAAEHHGINHREEVSQAFYLIVAQN
jgi:hypothetical protein